LGSIYALTDSVSNIVEYYEYDIYGAPSIYDVPDGQLRHSSAYANRYLFTGREYHTATELYYYRARWYSPILGRFLQRDPLESELWRDTKYYEEGIPEQLSPYSYAQNSPMVKIDSLGLQSCPIYCDITGRKTGEIRFDIYREYEARGVAGIDVEGGFRITDVAQERRCCCYQYRWIQVVDTNRPRGGVTSPYVDPRPPDDALPFYYTDLEMAILPLRNSSGYRLRFYDRPRRPPERGVKWYGYLCLVCRRPPTAFLFHPLVFGNDRILGCVRYGWRIAMYWLFWTAPYKRTFRCYRRSPARFRQALQRDFPWYSYVP